VLFQILVISVSLSIDAFGIGLSYKLKGVEIGAIARMIVGIMSSVIMYISILIGKSLMCIFPTVVMKIAGITILCLIGVTFIKNSLFGEDESKYDFNHSKKIEYNEALVLGTALSADGFSAGIAVAALELNSILVPVTVGLMQMCFLHLGSILVNKCCITKKVNQKFCGIFSGCLLIVIALIKGIYS